jgi:molybdenum cofactor synthesis domain-containing protein
MAETAGILVIGNEILSGKTADENSSFLSRELRELGVDVRKISIIPDDVRLIADEVRLFSGAFTYVFTTGGVGPTHDDLTMEGIAKAFDSRILRNAEMEAALRGYYPSELVEPNLKMAELPEPARLILVPGLWFPIVTVANVYIFPGVPEILRRKFQRIREMFRGAPFHLREIYLRADEGQIAALLHRLLASYPDLMLGSYPTYNNANYSLKLTLESKDSPYLKQAYDLLLQELGNLNLEPVQSAQRQ